MIGQSVLSIVSDVIWVFSGIILIEGLGISKKPNESE